MRGVFTVKYYFPQVSHVSAKTSWTRRSTWVRHGSIWGASVVIGVVDGHRARANDVPVSPPCAVWYGTARVVAGGRDSFCGLET